MEWNRKFILPRALILSAVSFVLMQSIPPEFCEVASLHLCEMLQKTTLQELGFHISFGISLPSSDIFMLHQLKKQSVQAH